MNARSILIEVLKDAKVEMNNGEIREYEAIYPEFNGIYPGKLTLHEGIICRSRKRKFGRSKPVEEERVCYYVFDDKEFLRHDSYRDFRGNPIKAYTGKLSNDELKEMF